ncbi:MAG: hypothetical protein N2504_07790 [candidate division WOR-3 bacterium]|nr:hypothetical protein [candidate division WOR-3 bacterium]
MYNYSSTMEEFSETDKILSWIPIVNIYVFGKLIVEIKLIKYIEHAQYLLLASRLLFVAGFIFTKPMLMMLAFIVYKVILLGGYRQYFEIMENDNTIVPVMCAITPILGSAIMYTHYRKA